MMCSPAENVAKHLFYASSLLSKDCVANRTVAYHMREICAKLQDKGVLKISRKQFGPQEQCKFCHKPWSDGFYQMRVLPVKHKKCYRKLLKKDDALLNRYQKKLKEKTPLRNFNILSIHCKQCQFSTQIKMEKPELLKMKVDKVDEEDIKTEVSKKKKKKKKKDNYAGLNPTVLLRNKNFLVKSTVSGKENSIVVNNNLETSSQACNKPPMIQDLHCKTTEISTHSDLNCLDNSLKSEDVKNSNITSKVTENSFDKAKETNERTREVNSDFSVGITVSRSKAKPATEVKASLSGIFKKNVVHSRKANLTIFKSPSNFPANSNSNKVVPDIKSNSRNNNNSVDKKISLLSSQTTNTVKKKKAKKKQRNKLVSVDVPEIKTMKKSSLILDQILDF